MQISLLPDIRYYFVDEAGDLTIFNKKGKVIVGQEGCSKVFMVGLLHLPEPEIAEQKLNNLRTRLMADPRFSNIPSMQPDAGKTALFFHAKNDVAEARQEVFKLLPELGAKVQVAIRRKSDLASAARLLPQQARQNLLQPSVIYDNLVARLFKNMLHQADENKIVFARLGKSERREALGQAITKAKQNYETSWGKEIHGTTAIDVALSSKVIGLQVIDYYLWALQRLYERGDDQFFLPLAKNYSMIMDLDDRRRKNYGEWYTKSNPLTLKKLMPVVS
jgi:hypothetical protein